MDIAKEKIAYLKLRLGIGVVTDISIVGWLLTHGHTASKLMLLGASLALVGMTFAAFVVHKRIGEQIESLEDL